MEWNVYYYDINRKKIDIYNVFEHSGFAKHVKQWLKKCNIKEGFAEKLKQEVKYYFWSKAEWETLISGWPPTKDREEEVKIDVYQQICLNWDVFVDYLWSFKEK